MLLIQSDMFKALWFMMNPIVTFAKGRIPNTSKFCQANGFFLSVGIEASGSSSPPNKSMAWHG
jgi:G protein-coupled receptor GPR1